MLSIIVAIANNNVIGGNNGLLWHLPEDLKNFKKITMTGSKSMIMGRKTFESLGRVLPERKHIILTNNKDFYVDNENVNIIHDIDSLKPYINSEEEYFVIGGGEIYRQLLPYTSKMYVTRVFEDFQGDTYFPQWDENQWDVIEESEFINTDKYPYKMITYLRK
ncbi:MAG: dihydrofolate reductase [Clostridiales bacterium]|uniref:dihydrofolate reductase n=1 Tax=Clostridium sp. N3C TaxID=1776758 RepID=UPI00092DFC97|nr:dihydrofolate reductase [Clostridium sp. N3C]NLZ48064.1 dihydrofolate reductase [Clostridiales bacterium]SCN22191.1 Dihydrofolate reductase [Clostridium sp. N3C]